MYKILEREQSLKLKKSKTYLLVVYLAIISISTSIIFTLFPGAGVFMDVVGIAALIGGILVAMVWPFTTITFNKMANVANVEYKSLIKKSSVICSLDQISEINLKFEMLKGDEDSKVHSYSCKLVAILKDGKEFFITKIGSWKITTGLDLPVQIKSSMVKDDVGPTIAKFLNVPYIRNDRPANEKFFLVNL